MVLKSNVNYTLACYSSAPFYNCQKIIQTVEVPFRDTRKTRDVVVTSPRMKLMGFKGNSKIIHEEISNFLRPLVEDWSGNRLEIKSIVYGIRRYLHGAWMSLHVDVLPTHVLSAILQVIADNVENLNIALQCTEMTSI